MFRGERRSATAEVVQARERRGAARERLQRLIRRNPDLALKLLASLADRVSWTSERLLQQSFQAVAGRVASACSVRRSTARPTARPPPTC